MKIIIAGDGKVGATLTRQLSDEGYDLILIDSNAKVLEAMVEKYDVLAVRGNCVSMETLEEAGVMSAELLIAVTSADELNMLCCLTAHSMNPNIHTIARIRNPEYESQVYKMRDAFGLSLTVNPEKQAAKEIVRLIKFPGFLQRDTFAKGRVEIVELKLNRDGKLDNVALKDVHSVVKCKILVCIVVRDGKALTPGGDFILKENDRIYVVGSTDALSLMLKNLGILTKKVNRAIICGGGRISYYLAKELTETGIGVQIIEKDYHRCDMMADTLPKAMIVNGDASNQELLDSEGLDTCDALVTLTGLDELNMIISLYGNAKNVPQIITKIDRVGNTQMLDALPIGSTICPKEICSESIVRYVRAMRNQKGAAKTIHSIADGQAEAMEFVVSDDTPYTGQALKDIKLREGTIIACINHGKTPEIASGNSSFHVGDTVIVVTAKKDVVYSLNDIFEN